MSVIKVRDSVFLPAAFTDGATARPLFNITAASDNPTPVVVAGTNVRRGVLEFTDGQASVARFDHLMPEDWHPYAGVDVGLLWYTTVESPLAARWTFESALAIPDDVAGGNAEIDPAYNTLQAVIDVATTDDTLALQFAVLTGLDLGLPDASDATRLSGRVLLSLRTGRTPAHASDTLGVSAFLMGAELRYWRALEIG